MCFGQWNLPGSTAMAWHPSLLHSRNLDAKLHYAIVLCGAERLKTISHESLQCFCFERRSSSRSRAEDSCSGQAEVSLLRDRRWERPFSTKKNHSSTPKPPPLEPPSAAKSNGHLSVPDNHRVRTAADPRKTAAFPRRAPSCVGLLSLSPRWRFHLAAGSSRGHPPWLRLFNPQNAFVH